MSARDKLARKQQTPMDNEDQATILAAGLLEPVRQAEVQRHHAAVLMALNSTADVNGEQDALAVLEAVAMTLGLMMGNLAKDERLGPLSFVVRRALHHAEIAAATGSAAHFRVEPDDIGQGGHA